MTTVTYDVLIVLTAVQDTSASGGFLLCAIIAGLPFIVRYF
jgi:hypothetical protein